MSEKMDKRLQLVLSERLFRALDELRKQEPDLPNRSEMVRRALVDMVKRRLPDWEQTDD